VKRFEIDDYLGDWQKMTNIKKISFCG